MDPEASSESGPLLGWLAGGDLRSDGLSDEVVDVVLANPELMGELLEGLNATNDVVRGRTADALEKIGRSRPDWLIGYLPLLVQAATGDEVPMVRWHLAMLLGHLAGYEEQVNQITSVLFDLLADESVFVRSWAIVSLTIIGRLYPGKCDQILNRIALYEQDDSVAIRSKALNAVKILTNDAAFFPSGWIKSDHLRGMLS